jgi:hypothetical protein
MNGEFGDWNKKCKDGFETRLYMHSKIRNKTSILKIIRIPVCFDQPHFPFLTWQAFAVFHT